MSEDRAQAADEQASMSGGPTIQDFLRLAMEKDATDLHISADSSPVMRVNGALRTLPFPPLAPNDAKTLCYSLLTESQKHRFEEQQELDFSFGIRGLSRFRGNLFMQRGAVGGAFRVIPYSARPLTELGLPAAAGRLTLVPRGLVLVTGPTGSGKSTTLAAMIDKINDERHEHIMTLEDPIEYVHDNRNCLVNQREVYSDTKSFEEALRHVLRQDPDVVLIGEMRDLETVSAALTVAETGHLALSTLHTNSAVQTITRIIDIFPERQQPQVRAQLSLVLQAVISQQLLPRADGRGRALATELMIPNPAIRNLIRENKVHQLYSQLQIGQVKFGMQTMSQSLLDLYTRRVISYEEAMGHATEPEELRAQLGDPANRSAAAGRSR